MSADFLFSGCLVLLMLVGASVQQDATADGTASECPDKPTGANEDLVDVSISLGTVTGHNLTTQRGTPYYAFKGIPFAQPPLGSLRFKPPVPVLEWENLEALQFKPDCPQMSVFTREFEGGEDCLYLNIFTPYLPESQQEESALRPVMVWIHGGAFMDGAAREYNPVKLVRKDVVVVTINYRLSSLGFLNFGNSMVEGNMGMRDQILALKWVQEHISAFGGDPQQVTLFGESAGGTSVHTLYMSPLAEGLFRSAIAQSGTALLWKYKYEASRPERGAQLVAKIFNCPSDELNELMLSCLQDIPVQDLITKTFQYGYLNLFLWRPTVDAYSAEPVVPQDPHLALKSGEFNKLPMMTGTLSNEAEYEIPLALFNNISAEDRNVVLGHTLGIAASSNYTEITEKEKLLVNIAERYYLGGPDYDVVENKPEIIDLVSDVVFISPDQEVAELMSAHVPDFYNYQLTFKDKFSFAPFYEVERGESVLEEMTDPVHGDDLYYLFCDYEHIIFNQTDSERIVSDMMLTYWTNFAKYGNPSPNVTDTLEPWLPYLTEKNYLELKPEPEMKKNLRAEQMLFWKRMIWT